MSPLQPISQVVQKPQELERKKRNGTARQVRQEKNSFFLVFCFLTFGMDRLGKIPRHQWKERLKISKLAKIESDSSSASKDIAPQSCENLQTSVLWEGEGGWQVCAPTIQTSVKFRDSEELYLR